MEKFVGMLGFILTSFFGMIGFFFGNVWLLGGLVGVGMMGISLYCLED